MPSANWIACSDRLPESGVVVETKIDDAKGERNVCTLKLSGALWFAPDDSTYIYYRPTHWRPTDAAGGRLMPSDEANDPKRWALCRHDILQSDCLECLRTAIAESEKRTVALLVERDGLREHHYVENVNAVKVARQGRDTALERAAAWRDYAEAASDVLVRTTTLAQRRTTIGFGRLEAARTRLVEMGEIE